MTGTAVCTDPDSSEISVRLADRDCGVAVSAKGVSDVVRQQVSVNSALSEQKLRHPYREFMGLEALR